MERNENLLKELQLLEDMELIDEFAGKPFIIIEPEDKKGFVKTRDTELKKYFPEPAPQEDVKQFLRSVGASRIIHIRPAEGCEPITAHQES